MSSNWHAKRQSTSVVKPDVRFQIVKQTRASSNPTTRSTSTTSCINPTSRSCWVAELATQEGNVVSVLEAVTVPAVVWIYFICLTLFFIFDKLSLYVFRTRVFFWPALYMKLYIFNRKYTSCYPGSNIDVSTHCFLCSFVSTTCKYNWIYRLQFWDLKSIISVLGF